MKAALALIVAVLICLASGLASPAQELEFQDKPDGCDPWCFYLNLRELYRLQGEGGAISSVSGSRLLINSEPSGRIFSEEMSSIFVVGDETIPVPSVIDEVVRITFGTGGQDRAICTGVALGRDLVLTAGHCSCAEIEGYQIEFPRAANDRRDGKGPRFHPVRSLSRQPLQYPGYDCARPLEAQPGVDLGLLFVQPPQFQMAAFDPVPPPAAAAMLPYQLMQTGRLRSLLIMGYGRTLSNEFPRELIAAFTEVRDMFCLSDPDCAPFREFSLSNLATSVIADTCDGDSGGPVYLIAPRLRQDGKAELHRLLVGITSRGLGSVPQFGPGNCGGGGIYTAVGHPDILKWLAVNGAPLEVWPRARRFARQFYKPATDEDLQAAQKAFRESALAAPMGTGPGTGAPPLDPIPLTLRP